MASEKRLIDANVLLAEYDRVHIGEPGNARKLIEQAPTVDAVEVVHGRWIIHKGHFHDFAECSVCGEDYGKDTAMAFNYCPNCGAKMDGDGDG